MTGEPRQLTPDEAYRAAFCFLEACWRRGGGVDGGSEEVALILSNMSLNVDGLPMDPAYADDWQTAVKEAFEAPTAANVQW